jgi:beta-N-acetylhexosaminidase
MVGHGIYPGLGTAPASGNYKIVTKLLRNEMGYEGIIITDSMTMKGAAANLPSDQNLYRRAINAGNDVILMPGNPRQIRNLIAADLREGRISLSERRISISRVIAWQSARSRVAATLRVYGPGDPTLLNEARTFQAKYS